MIVVDTSVWIAHFRNEASQAVAKLRGIGNLNDIVVGDLVLLECLQGARDERHAAILESSLRAFQVVAMLDLALVIDAARYYRALRAMGLTPRKTVDIIIGAFCIARGCQLLHQDRDFEPMAAHLGLQVF